MLPKFFNNCSVNGKIQNFNGDNIDLLPLIYNIGLHKDILNLYSDLKTVWTLKDPAYILKARGLYLMILQRYFQIIIFQKDTSIMDTRIKKVLLYMSHHYNEPLTVEMMADMSNLSNMYFGSLFKKKQEPLNPNPYPMMGWECYIVVNTIHEA